MTKVAKVKKRKRRRRPSPRNSGDGPGNCHSRMHRSESARQTGFALYDQAEQKESAHAEPPREKEIQSVFAEAHASSRNQIIANATQDRQTPVFLVRRLTHTPLHLCHPRRSQDLELVRRAVSNDKPHDGHDWYHDGIARPPPNLQNCKRRVLQRGQRTLNIWKNAAAKRM